MRQFYAVTEDTIKSARTTLTSDISAGTMAIPVKNTAQYRTNRYICLSKEGDERAELIQITSIGNKIINVESPGTANAHYKDETVVQFDYNQRRLFRRTSPTAEWAHVAVESPRDIAVDNPLGTLFEDGDGTPDYEYIATYYNSFTQEGTTKIDAKTLLSTASNNLCSIQQIRDASGFSDNYNIPDTRLDEIRQDAQGEVWAALRNRYTFPITRKSSFLRRIVVDMCVGLLYINEYGSQVENVALNGYEKLKEARGKLGKLASGEYTLYDEVEDEDNALSTRDTISFYPDNTTEDEDDERMFSIGDEF